MPGGNKNIKPEDNTNGFQKNPQNINKEGRPKKIYTILKKTGYTASDVKTAFGELAFYSQKELKEVCDDESKPIITRIVANQFLTAKTKADYNRIREILEHTIGKPKQDIKTENKHTFESDPFKQIRENSGLNDPNGKTEESS